MNARQRSREDLRVHNAIARQQGLDPSSFKAWSAWFAWGTGPLAHIHRALRRGRAYADKRRVTPSSGCIWTDLGLEPPTPEQEAAALQSMRRSAAATQGLLDYYDLS